MKFNISYVKKNPVMFGVIFVVFGVILWMLMNKGGATGGGTTYVDQGPSEMEIAAQTQLAQAQIAAGVQTAGYSAQIQALQVQGANDLALGTISAQVALADLASQETLGKLSIQAQEDMMALQLTSSLAMTQSNNNFMLDYASNAADAAYDQIKLNADLQRELSLQYHVFDTIGNLKKKDRDESLQIVTGMFTGNPVNFSNGSGSAMVATPGTALPTPSKGGGLFSTIGKLVSPVASLA